MLNENTRAVLKSLTSVSNSAIFRHPITTVAQKDKSLIAFLNIADLGEEEFEEFGISFMSDFLNLVEFYKDATIEINDGVIDMKTETSHQRYRSTELDIMKSFDFPSALLDNINKAEATITFDISNDDLTRFKKISSLVKSDYFIVSDSDITVCKLDAKDNMLDESTTEILTSTNEDVEERIVFAMTSIDKLPSQNYTVKIVKNPKTGNYISVWSSQDQPINIVVSVEKAIKND